jgi:hypothetical protein
MAGGAVMSCINLLSTGPAAKEKCDILWPLILRCFAVAPATTPPDGMLASTYLTLLEDLANLKVRLLGLVIHLSPPKGNLMHTNEAALVEHIIPLLHETPVSAANSKDLLVYCRHLFAKYRKSPSNDEVVVFLHKRMLDIVGGGELFSRQRATSQRVLAHTLVQELLTASVPHLPLDVLDKLLDIFAVELLNTSLAVQVHIKSIDMLRLIQEHLCQVAKESPHGLDTASRGKDGMMRKMLGKSLTAVLHKLEYQARVVCLPCPLGTALLCPCPDLPA